MAHLLSPPEQRWWCPRCDLADVTRHALKEGEAAQRFHNCRGLAGLSVPMLPAGVKAKVEAREREDYIGNEIVQTDANGRPVMAVVTTRDDGEDCTVYAPTAIARSE